MVKISQQGQINLAQASVLKNFGVGVTQTGKLHWLAGSGRSGFAAKQDVIDFISGTTLGGATGGFDGLVMRFRATHGPSKGRFLKTAEVMSAIYALEGIPILKVDVAVPVQVSETLNYVEETIEKAEFLMQHVQELANIAEAEFNRMLPSILEEINDIAQRVISERVYMKEPEITRYISRENIKSTINSAFFDRSRTYNLMQSVVAHLVGANKIVVDIDESMCPYWLWVEKGHRVVMPFGVEVGTFVGERPFINEVRMEIQKYLSTVVSNNMEMVTVDLLERALSWMVSDQTYSGIKTPFRVGAGLKSQTSYTKFMGWIQNIRGYESGSPSFHDW
ncbi:MAG: hypothetical protein WC998_00555 [Candidatus Paceibacterota bacterium]|jgi:hypothetical protein